MWLFGSINEAIAGDDQAEKNPTIIEPIETAKEAKICVLVTLESTLFSGRKILLCVSERNIVVALKWSNLLWQFSLFYFANVKSFIKSKDMLKSFSDALQ